MGRHSSSDSDDSRSRRKRRSRSRSRSRSREDRRRSHKSKKMHRSHRSGSSSGSESSRKRSSRSAREFDEKVSANPSVNPAQALKARVQEQLKSAGKDETRDQISIERNVRLQRADEIAAIDGESPSPGSTSSLSKEDAIPKNTEPTELETPTDYTFKNGLLGSSIFSEAISTKEDKWRKRLKLLRQERS